MPLALPPTGRLHPTAHGLSRRRLALGAAAVLGLDGCQSLSLPDLTEPPPPGLPAVVPFSASRRTGGLPTGWQAQVMRPDLPITRYEVQDRDGRRVVHAVADAATSGLRCNVDIDPVAQPWLQWEWRVDALRTEATVAEDELDDCPTRLLVAFDGDITTLPLRDRLFFDRVELFTGVNLPFATLMYVWDGQAPAEAVLTYPRSSRIRYLVVQSGTAGTGRWLAYRRNVVDDYRRVFGAEPGRILGVGVLTDSDDLKGRAEAWFGDLRFSAA